MKTEKEMLDKIAHDKRLNPQDYTIYYRDKGELKQIPFNSIKRIEGSFMAIDCNGREATIPLHRIRKITEGGKTVWQRSPAA
ncbi:DUF504 domain-containing protein [Candidatus Woesearchaeota archaeon]|nr:MAG: DUF504 domain-containing protein [Candidatus Woesearchaeota archaeon]